jgi:predicted GIY-YIG superfamily endonuclease
MAFYKYKLYIKMSFTIYILELENDKFYVGKTNRPDVRLNEHFLGQGSAWTAKYPPKKILELYPNSDRFAEDMHTKRYMAKYGIDSTRGGCYSQIELSKDIKDHLRREINAALDRCYRCERQGHYGDSCTETRNCRQEILSDDYVCTACHKIFFVYQDAIIHVKLCKHALKERFCSRCGYQTHNRVNCHAIKDIKGDIIL